MTCLLVGARDQESHGVAGDLDVLQRSRVPLLVIAVQQRFWGPSADDEGDLPGGVLGVEDSGVQAAGAER